MRILVIGAGALGGYFGGCLLRAGRDVTFLVRSHRAEQLARRGLEIVCPHGDFTVPAPTIGASDGCRSIKPLQCRGALNSAVCFQQRSFMWLIMSDKAQMTAPQTPPRFEKDGWCYEDDPPPGDARKLVSLEQEGMCWVGIRACDFHNERWLNNGEPETATVVSWCDLPTPCSGWWEHGRLVFPVSPESEKAIEQIVEATKRKFE
jgi:hypothetical protein